MFFNMEVYMIFLALLLHGCDGYDNAFDLIRFGELNYFRLPSKTFNNRSVHVMKEDVNRPGSFIFGSGSALMRYDPGSGHSIICGNLTERGNKDGRALDARFFRILDFVQYNKTKIAMADFGNHCIREFDSSTNLVKTLIGVCSEKVYMQPFKNQRVPMTTGNILMGVLGIEYFVKSNFFLVKDYGSKYVYKVEINKQTIEILDVTLCEKYIPNTRYFLPTSDESGFYASHSFGISLVTFETLKAELIVGSISHDDPTKQPVGLLDGSFSTAVIGSVNSPVWLIPDHIFIAAGSNENEALLLFDLQKKMVYALCNGTMASNVTVTGPFSACQVNSVGGLFVSDSKLFIYGAGEGHYSTAYRTSTALLEIDLYIERCNDSLLSANGILSQRYAMIGQSAILSCAEGYGLFYNTTRDFKCVESSDMPNTLTWDEPFPKCSSKLYADSIKPTRGQAAGGTIITAVGIVPDKGACVKLRRLKDNSILLYISELKRAKFTMPPGLPNEVVEIEIQLNSTNTSYVYTYTYTANPSVQNSSLVTLFGSGAEGFLYLANAQSSQTYELMSENGHILVGCGNEHSLLKCRLPAGHSLSPFFERNSTRTHNLTLLSEGIPIAQNLTMEILPDPVFHRDNQVLIGAGLKVILHGRNLDIGPLNKLYEVYMFLKPERKFKCEVDLLKVNDSQLPCIVHQEEEIPKDQRLSVMVNVGDLKLEAGKILLPSSSSSSPSSLSSDHKMTAIVASVVTVSIVIIITLFAVICYLKYRTPFGAVERLSSLASKNDHQY